ncbi:MAG: hypothetical protein PGN07_05450 [Aeromicrobium erythreum]
MSIGGRALAALGVVVLLAVWLVPVRTYDDRQLADSDVRLVDAWQGWPAITLVLATLLALVVVVRGRPVPVLVVAGVAAAVAVTRVGAGDLIIWDGQDAQGRPTGGLERPQWSWGVGVGMVGGVLLVLAAGLDLVRSLRSRSPRG